MRINNWPKLGPPTRARIIMSAVATLGPPSRWPTMAAARSMPFQLWPTAMISSNAIWRATTTSFPFSDREAGVHKLKILLESPSFESA
jgi:hypothetical protein